MSSPTDESSARQTTIPNGVVSLADYEAHFRLAVEPAVFEYVQSGAADEHTVARNTEAFGQIDLLPRVLNDLSAGTTSTTLLGRAYRHPILLGPVAYQKLVHPDGELATARAADATDSGLVLSTLSSVSIEAVARELSTNKWFQLYFRPSREATLGLVRRIEAAGFSALVVTVDAPVSGARNRIQRAGFSLPSAVRAVNLDGESGGAQITLNPDDSVIFQGYMSEAPSWRDLEWLAGQTQLPILVKGIMSPLDAKRIAQMGLGGLIVSNHGGRCLDTVPATVDVLQAVRAAAGPELTILLDGGVRRGTDVFKALALGADAILLGRPQLHGLAVAGALGVAHLIKILREELETAMALTGCASIGQISPDSVSTRRLPVDARYE